MRFILLLLLCTSGLLSCVSTQGRRVDKSETGQPGRSNSFEPYVPKEAQEAPTRRKSKKSYRARYAQTLEEKKEEFRERMKENAKKDRKMQREMKKPQYSDPLYFGHKKKPKKRKPGKRKFCKECGIVH